MSLLATKSTTSLSGSASRRDLGDQSCAATSVPPERGFGFEVSMGRTNTVRYPRGSNHGNRATRRREVATRAPPAAHAHRCGALARTCTEVYAGCSRGPDYSATSAQLPTDGSGASDENRTRVMLIDNQPASPDASGGRALTMMRTNPETAADRAELATSRAAAVSPHLPASIRVPPAGFEPALRGF